MLFCVLDLPNVYHFLICFCILSCRTSFEDHFPYFRSKSFRNSSEGPLILKYFSLEKQNLSLTFFFVLNSFIEI